MNEDDDPVQGLGRAQSLPTNYTSFFPSFRNRRHHANHAHSPSPSGPTIYDENLVSRPIFEHSDTCFAEHYPEEYMINPAQASLDPDDLKDPYLFPRLAKNEVQRLTSLWYYTKEIMEDKHLLDQIQNVVDLVHQLMGCDCTIVGLMDHDYYTRIVTKGCPLAVLPRREATCAHTIIQKPGTVFMLPDMSKDWRFKNSPHVVAGLRFYAGTQLRFRVPESEVDIVFGSLCVASYTAREPMNKSQQQQLTKFADIIVNMIVERAELLRMSTREQLSAKIIDISKKVTVDNVKETVLNGIRELYPDTHVSYQIQPKHVLHMHDRTDLPYDKFSDFLWENTEVIDEHIRHYNHVPWAQSVDKIKTTLRAIAIPMVSVAHSYLVVESSNLKHVLDDIDVGFIGACGMLICTTLQSQFLKKALDARAQFMRGVSHELRTPIHGILSTCELILEETRNQMKPDTDQESINLDKISAMLKLVDASGRDLLTTVNNLLDYDRLGGQMQIEPHVSSQSLDRIEQHVVDSVLIPSSKPELTLIADNLLPPDVEIIMTDFDLLTQCLHSVLENAVNFAEKGTIIFKMSLSEDDHSLDFEVYDSGPGIPDQDKHRIFEPFEKVNEFSRGPGLGLAISSRIALALGGRLDLVTTSSEGSMFRLRLMNAGFACSRSSKYRFITKNCRMPLTYHMPVNRELETMPLTYTARNIERLGFHEADEQHASLDIVEAAGIAIDQSLKKVLGDVAGYRKIAIYVATSSDEIDDAREAARGETFEGRVVRCYAPTCRARLWTVIMKAAEIWDRLNLEDRLSESLKIEMKSVSPPRKKRSREGMRLLLVDDNKTNLGILIMYCKKRKFAYDTAMDGKEAVAKFESTVDDFSLVLMDLQMPVMDGANATKEIRTIEKTNNKRSSLIFMVTGQSTEEDRQRCVEAGANGYYVKPVSIRALDDLIQLHFPA